MTRDRRTLVLASLAWMGWVAALPGAPVASFELGATSRPGVCYSPESLHASPGPDLIRVKFDSDVHVSFYNLQLGAVSLAGYSLHLEGFSYDASSHVAIWQLSGLSSDTNDRFQAILSGITDLSGHPLSGGPYTNSYTILTGDVTGDEAISALDVLTIINAINGGEPYDPHRDVNFDGEVSPLDVLMVITKVNAFAPPLIAAGPYLTIPMVPPPPPPPPQITYFACGKELSMTISDIPAQAWVLIQQSDILPATNWQTISTFFATSTVTNLTLPRDWTKRASFYRAQFE